MALADQQDGLFCGWIREEGVTFLLRYAVIYLFSMTLRVTLHKFVTTYYYKLIYKLLKK